MNAELKNCPFCGKEAGYIEAMDSVCCENCQITVPLKLWQTRVEDKQELYEILEYVAHDQKCLCSQFQQGRPTEDGGYETKYGYGENAKWFKRGEEPPCSCGLNNLIARLKNKKTFKPKAVDREGLKLPEKKYIEYACDANNSYLREKLDDWNAAIEACENAIADWLEG